MAKEHSLDISAKIDMQTLKDALNQVDREITNRFDFKGTTWSIDYKEKEKIIVVIASSDNKLDALVDILIAKLLKHGLSSKVLDHLKTEDASGNTRKATYKVVDYIEAKEAKKIVSEIKKLKTKATAQIDGDHIRVKSKNIDDLQKIMKEIRSQEFEAPLVFENMR